MNLILAVIFVLSGSSFSYRYTSWFACSLTTTNRQLQILWLYGLLLQISLFLNFLLCDFNIWITTLFVLAISLATVHDIILHREICIELFGVPVVNTSTPPITFEVSLACATALVVRSTTESCKIGNGVLFFYTVAGAVFIVFWWRYRYMFNQQIKF